MDIRQYIIGKRMKGVIFDLDGTLLDSMEMWHQIDVEFFAKRNMTLPPDYQAAVTPMGAYDAAVYTIGRFGFSETPQELMAEWDEMAYRHYREDLELKPFALEYVRRLSGRGIPMAIASSSARRMIEAACARTGLDREISLIVTAPELQVSKESPEIYLRTAELMGVPPEDCVVYEDIVQAVESAKAAGCTAVGVYEPSYAFSEQLEQAADWYIRSFQEVM